MSTNRSRDVYRANVDENHDPLRRGRLQVSVRAVEKHVTNIFLKLGLPPADQAHRRVLAVLRYLEHGAESR